MCPKKHWWGDEANCRHPELQAFEDFEDLGLECGDVWNGCVLSCAGRKCKICGDNSLYEETTFKDGEIESVELVPADPEFRWDGEHDPFDLWHEGEPVEPWPLSSLHTLWTRLITIADWTMDNAVQCGEDAASSYSLPHHRWIGSRFVVGNDWERGHKRLGAVLDAFGN